jgi:hypothetical protein
MLIKEGAEKVSKLDYPNFWHQGNLKLRLTYQFEPGGCRRRDGAYSAAAAQPGGRAGLNGKSRGVVSWLLR